ncbi:MAG: 2-C-methyl-D-erythritol 4-phosphate cytidylyltransferase [Clostridiaceae bacterium]|nr:2-C-methyl-D-erythritol 4-phosphate cytidylyltransferase [Clostridiaceae bacterium]
MPLFSKKVKNPPYVTAVLAAGGSGERMGCNKLLMELAGMPVLGHSLLALENCEIVREVVIAAREDMIVEYANLAAKLDCSKVRKVIKGGKTRLESVYCACCEAMPETEILVVQDAARPLTSPAEIEAVIRAAAANQCAVAAVPVRDTMKRAGRDGRIQETVEREGLFAAQTPQAADKTLLLAALKRALDESVAVTDECMALERMGLHPVLVSCSSQNIKLTTPEDLLLAEAILEMRCTQ